jgi:hypothetical protein
MNEHAEGMWLGIKRCGCIDGVTKDIQGNRAIKAEKASWLAAGRSVVYVTPDEWRAKYLALFLEDCTHESVEATP